MNGLKTMLKQVLLSTRINTEDEKELKRSRKEGTQLRRETNILKQSALIMGRK